MDSVTLWRRLIFTVNKNVAYSMAKCPNSVFSFDKGISGIFFKFQIAHIMQQDFYSP